MKFILFFSLLFLSGLSLSQTKQDSIPAEIHNTRTPRHVYIPGTHIYLTLPPGFKIGTAFSGILKNKDTYLQISEVYDGNYFSSIASYNKEAFEKGGAKVPYWRELNFDGYSAKYFHFLHDHSGYNLVFGDNNFFVIVMVKYMPNDEASGRELRNALLSMYYDPNKVVDPFEGLFFKIDDKNSPIKFSKYATGTYIYTPGGIKLKEYKDEPVFVASPLPYQKDQKLQAILESRIPLLQQAGLLNFTIQNAKAGVVNGNPSYSFEVYGKLNGKPVGYYMEVIAKGENAVEMEGRATDKIPENMVVFKNLAQTVKLK